MYFPDKASKLFPNAKWTGQSSIHVSIAREGQAPLDWDNKSLIMKSLVETHFCGAIQRVILKACPQMEWLMSNDDFEDLLLVDFHRLLHGQNTQETKYRLKNPSTGNKFHRVTLLAPEDVIGGVRVWIGPLTHNAIHIGFRYRMETLKGEDEHAKVRQMATMQIVDLQEEIAQIKEFAGKATEDAVMVEEHVEL